MISEEVALQDELPPYNYDAYCIFLNIAAQASSVESGWIVPFSLFISW